MATITDVYGNELNVYSADEWRNPDNQEVTWQKVSESTHTSLVEIRRNGGALIVVIAEDLTMDQAKEIVRKMASINGVGPVDTPDDMAQLKQMIMDLAEKIQILPVDHYVELNSGKEAD